MLSSYLKCIISKKNKSCLSFLDFKSVEINTNWKKKKKNQPLFYEINSITNIYKTITI